MGRRRSSPGELRRQIAALSAAPTVETTLREATELVRQSVPFDDWIWLTYDPQTILPTAAVDDGQTWELRLAHCANEHLDDDVNKFRTLAGAPVPVATLDRATHGARTRSPRYNELLRPQGIEQEMRAALVTDGLCWGSLTLLRGKGTADFSADEVAAVAGITDVVAQRLRQAVRRTQAHHRAVDGPAGTAGPGIVVVGPNGELEQVTPAAEPWLRLLTGEEDRATSGRPAPIPLAGLAVRAGAVARQRSTDGIVTPPRLRVCTLTGDWLTVYAVGDLDEPTGQRTTLVLEPSRPSDLLPLLARAYRFTPREEQIVQLVLLGHSTRQISNRLGISAHTVQDHLKSVFDKADVRSRRELTYRFALAFW
jgi:DNA-binding CsgD family transcriptional regulator